MNGQRKPSLARTKEEENQSKSTIDFILGKTKRSDKNETRSFECEYTQPIEDNELVRFVDR
jgi:hypothetical protein